MASKFNSPSSLTAIPRELRSIIYDNLEDEDLAPLAQTCQQIRTEVLSRMPGGRFIDFGKVHDHSELRSQIHKTIEIKNLDLIAEPWYSLGSALKIGVTWKPRDEDYIHWRTSYWTIRDLSSPMARYIYLYCPDAISITFQAATKGYLLLALLILRTKMFDICRILKTINRDLCFTPSTLNIQFCGGRDPDRPTVARTPFWEMRPRCNVPNWIIHQEAWKNTINKKSHQDREVYPFFYECLMLPLISYSGEGSMHVNFDLQPAQRRTSFQDRTMHGQINNPNDYNRIQIKYLGHKALFDFADYCYHLHLKDIDYYGNDYTESFEKVMDCLESFTEDTDAFLRNAKCQEAYQLRSYLRRMRQAPICNPFAGPLEGNPFEEQDAVQMRYEGYVWRCYGEDNFMRQRLIEWAME
ncbi:hypothetical protein F4813DRAFT_395981 [Daldinia decipiens]|uniref:uncharacterized protein n=1 Tax=Daldinia decipiens TaxID=326647 RepID=UPI0020C24FC8|nr:uncharacterized protein F4813DRAFT_395981 [Daldinia decipiens]KAI1658301.1 hypothetical protein F4813DRAFT_395981 [Daldinia decipiens]